MTPIKRKLLYIFRGTLLRLRITWNHGQSLTLSVGYHVDKEDAKGKLKWDGSRCKPNTTHGDDKIPASVINKVLEQLEDKIEKAFYQFESADMVPTPQQLRLAIYPNEIESESINTLFGRFIREEESRAQWAFNTVKSVTQVQSLLSMFKPDMTIEDLSVRILNEFSKWQQTHRISNKKSRGDNDGYSNATIAKHNNIIKWFLKWAAKQGYNTSGTERSFTTSVKTISKPVVFLTWEELMRVESLHLELGSPKDRARDFFCFCAFSSLRYSDAIALLKSSIRENSFDIVTQKTNKKITIDLNDHSRRILAKYKDSSSEKALPYLSTGTLNSMLKKIGKMAGLDDEITVSQFYGSERVNRTFKKYELLSSHAGRRTFICNALSLGISPNVVMKWTGHSDYNAMKPYIDIADEIRASEMKKFNQK